MNREKGTFNGIEHLRCRLIAFDAVNSIELVRDDDDDAN